MADEEKKGLGDKIKDGLGSAKDKVAGAMDADGDGKIEAEDFKDNAVKVGGKIKDGVTGLGNKIKSGFKKSEEEQPNTEGE